MNILSNKYKTYKDLYEDAEVMTNSCFILIHLMERIEDIEDISKSRNVLSLSREEFAALEVLSAFRLDQLNKRMEIGPAQIEINIRNAIIILREEMLGYAIVPDWMFDITKYQILAKDLWFLLYEIKYLIKKYEEDSGR